MTGRVKNSVAILKGFSLYTSYFEKFTEEDIIKYLLRQTVLQEISKLSDYEQIQQPSDNNQS